ncbi:Transcription elongation factor SPT6-like protein [Bienertia sinuspersici]
MELYPSCLGLGKGLKKRKRESFLLDDQQLEAEEPQDLNDKDDGMAHSTLDEENDLVDYAESLDIMVSDTLLAYHKNSAPLYCHVPSGGNFLFVDPETGEDVSHDKPALQRHKVLWAVHDLDRKWLLLQKRKKALQGNYNMRFEEISCKIDDETRLRFNRQVYESIISALRLAESERELDDVNSKFNLHFPPGEAHVGDVYKRCKEAGLWKVASKFGYSSEQLVDEMEDPKETPEDVASNFTYELFDSVEDVLKLARYMASVDLSHEPCVKNHVRSYYFDNAVVSTRPISDGNAVIDGFHQLCDKPLNEFEDAQWLLIQKAEEKELLQVTIKLPEENLLELISESEKLYLSVSVSELAQLWNVQTRMIIGDAIIDYILPALEKEARSLLTNRAKNWLLLDYGERLWDKASVAPYQTKKRESSSDDEVAPRVMACCWGSGDPPTTFVMLDSYGEIVDVLEAELMSSGIRNDTDKLNLVKFMMKNQPQVVVVGVVNLSCIWLKDDIYERDLEVANGSYRSDMGRAKTHKSCGSFRVMGSSIRRKGIYVSWVQIEKRKEGGEGSGRGGQEWRVGIEVFRGRVSGVVGVSRHRRGVGLGSHGAGDGGGKGRDKILGRELDWVSVVSGDESLPRLYENSSISDDQIPMEEGKVTGYLQNPLAMVANLCALSRKVLSWKLSPLESFLNADEKYAVVEQIMVDVTNQVGVDLNLAANHDWLFAPMQFISGLGPRKAAALERSLSGAKEIVSRKDLLTHGLGTKVYDSAAGFLRIRRCGDDVGIEMAIKNIREDPSAWKAFDVDAYAKDTECLSKAKTLRQTVKATVRCVKTELAICELECGLTGMLLREDCSDDWRDVDLTGKLHEGDTLTCKIKRFQKTWYLVYLTCRENDMRNIGHQNGEKTVLWCYSS